MGLHAILLDVDGTLVASNAAHAQAWSEACAELGYDRPASFFRPLIGMGGDRVVQLVDRGLNDRTGPGKELTERRREIFLTRFLPTLKPTPGAADLVERLHHDGLRIVIATSAKRDELDGLLRIAGIRPLVDATTTSDDAAESKPAPDIVLAALRAGNVSAESALLLGDTPYDVLAAARAGVGTIALRCGGWNDERLAGAVEIYDDPADLLRQYDASAIRRLALR